MHNLRWEPPERHVEATWGHEGSVAEKQDSVAEKQDSLAEIQSPSAETQGFLAGKQESSAEIQGSCAETQGSFPEKQGSFAETQGLFLETHPSQCLPLCFAPRFSHLFRYRLPNFSKIISLETWPSQFGYRAGF